MSNNIKDAAGNYSSSLKAVSERATFGYKGFIAGAEWAFNQPKPIVIDDTPKDEVIFRSKHNDKNKVLSIQVTEEKSIEQMAIKESEKQFPYDDFRGKEKGVDDEKTGQALRGACVGGYEAAYKANTVNKELLEALKGLYYSIDAQLINYRFGEEIGKAKAAISKAAQLKQ